MTPTMFTPQEMTVLSKLPPRLRLEAVKRRAAATNISTVWQPNPDHEDGTPNPQRLAVESKADILGYGGAAGGGKTDLLLGLAGSMHKRSVIFRRVFPNLRGIIERSREIFNPDAHAHGNDSYNESLHRWSLNSGKRTIEFEACQYEKDKEKQRGRPRDFYGFDEATEFSRSQIEFIIAWLRSTEAGQRCRVVLTFNPPIDSGGSWIVDYFLPWIAYLFPQKFSHPNPAKPGELRWYATIDGKETERPNGDPFEHNGETIKPLSRSFIPAKLQDNPHLANTNYSAIIDSLPEPLRSQLKHGDFTAAGSADPWQVIPTAWVRAAQLRWMEQEKPKTPLSAVGADMVRGGGDNFALSKRYGHWFDEVVKIPGVNIEDGPAAAALVYHSLQDERHIGVINIDVVGIGSSPYDSLKVMYPGKVHPVSAGERDEYIAMSKTDPPNPLFKMRNVRAAYYWQMREALDPAHGNNIALPPGNEIVSDLCAARYKLLAGGVVQIEEKDEIKKRIGRSPDVGEAIMMANYKPTFPVVPGKKQVGWM
jgi:hypothetical protein